LGKKLELNTAKKFYTHLWQLSVLVAFCDHFLKEHLLLRQMFFLELGVNFFIFLPRLDLFQEKSDHHLALGLQAVSKITASGFWTEIVKIYILPFEDHCLRALIADF
jgi:hypothetical protein